MLFSDQSMIFFSPVVMTNSFVSKLDPFCGVFGFLKFKMSLSIAFFFNSLPSSRNVSF